MLRKIFALVALFALAVKAQNFTIDPGTVDPSTRDSWCTAEINNCQNLCGGSAKTTTNNCNSDTLVYSCICSNGSAPGLQYYDNTMPSLICEQLFSNCIKANENNQSGQAACNTTIKAYCGTLDPTKLSSTAGTSSAGAASTGTSTGTAGAASSTATTQSTSTSKAGAPTNLAMIGNGAAVVAAGLFAALL